MGPAGYCTTDPGESNRRGVDLADNNLYIFAPTRYDSGMEQADKHHKYGLDRDGYRKNVGIIVCNHRCQVLWARRVRHDGWQFPQGGVKPDESAQEAAFRELQEEIGLAADDVHLIGATDEWLRYEVPYAAKPRTTKLRLYRRPRQFRGQKQRWFLFRLLARESSVRLDFSSTPEFDQWRWVDYWYPPEQIVDFKKGVYQKALTELEPLMHQTEPLFGEE